MTDIILFAAGLLIGVINSISGGGMLFGFPVLLAFGVSPIVASATTTIIVLPGNLAAIWGYRKHLHKVPRHYLLLLIPVTFGGALGATLLKYTSPENFNQFIPFLVILAVILFAFQPKIYKSIHQQMHRPSPFKIKVRPFLFTAIATFPIAVYGGFFGAGFGFIMLAFLSFTRLHDHIHRINALKSIVTTCLAFVALLCLAGSQLIDWRYGLVMSAGCFLGGYLGATKAQKTSIHSIRVFIVITGMCTAAYLSVSGF